MNVAIRVLHASLTQDFGFRCAEHYEACSFSNASSSDVSASFPPTCYAATFYLYILAVAAFTAGCATKRLAA